MQAGSKHIEMSFGSISPSMKYLAMNYYNNEGVWVKFFEIDDQLELKALSTTNVVNIPEHWAN